ncbi:MAG: NBR1-Ig-like domain-containing protein [Anaerolineales bacterium]|nr:NBR1-Ig-like domain-containing protein [Anaerolineales bacterium]MCX7754339.1 NBR1-Ig-like domain-containing protein [Anaerolineales bacterium]MDW8279058.1 NBR1-Ig-like domain-containing protein [Anaerolineales bacterium]
MKKSSLTALLLAVVILFGLWPSTHPAAAATRCDWAQFVADITVPDGTTFRAGESFNKTWRIRNIGSCTWNTDYSLVFVSGAQMNAPASIKLPKSVAPGQSVDLTVSMTAPNAAGTHRGNWQLKNASGVLFGIGANADKSFWVEIKVSGAPGATGYDFVENAASAAWTSGAGTLTFPGTEGDAKGFARRVDSPKLENGSTSSLPGLLMAPQNVTDGYIQAVYPAFRVERGDRFQATIGCEYNATSCWVNFRLQYQIGSGAVETLWSFNEKHEGLVYRADIDLSRLAGQDVKFILRVNAAGSAAGDRVLWAAPQIVRGGAPAPTATPGPSRTPTPTPAPGACTDRIRFVADVTVPDGTTFAPNTNFTKTWRVKNVGTCTFNINYYLVYVSGDKLGTTEQVKFTSTIAPNTTFDLSVNLTAPAANGTYRGYWQLKNDKGQLFGIGANYDKPFWVEIKVAGGATAVPTNTPLPTTPVSFGTIFDFAASAASAAWTSGAGSLPFPGTEGDAKGFVLKLDNVEMENGKTENAPSLLTFPQNVNNGYIQGVFPAFRVERGDQFRATVGCQYRFNACYVTYRLEYQIGSDPVKVLWNFTEKYEGLLYNVNLDLSALAGKDVKFILKVLAAGPAANDRAVWVNPRIVRAGNAATATATPVTPTATSIPPTATPTATFLPPTATATLPPATATPVPDTATPEPTATATP